MTLEEMNSRVFAECLHTTFTVEAEEAGTDLELVEVSERPDPNVEQFSLIFRGPADRSLPQAIHSLDHAKLGRCELFLVPIGPDSSGLLYQAVFNRLRPR